MPKKHVRYYIKLPVSSSIRKANLMAGFTRAKGNVGKSQVLHYTCHSLYKVTPPKGLSHFSYNEEQGAYLSDLLFYTFQNTAIA